MTRLLLAAAWYRARRKAHVTGLPQDPCGLTHGERLTLDQMALLYYLTALDPQRSPKGRKR